MTLSSELQALVEQARAAVVDNPTHELNPFYRSAIYALLRPSDWTDRNSALAWLHLFTARHVFPFWQQVWPEIPVARRLLNTAEAVIKGEADPAKADKERDRSWDELEGFGVSTGE